MDSSDVAKGAAAEASAYNALRADVIAAATVHWVDLAPIKAAGSFHADYVQFEDEVRFEGDANFKASIVGGDEPTYHFTDEVGIGWDPDTSHLNVGIGGDVVGYFDATGWHNV